MKDGLHVSRKDELFNDLIDEFKTRELDFPKTISDTDGAYCKQVYKCNETTLKIKDNIEIL
jgi:hypothetical protein